MSAQIAPFGQTADGRTVHRIALARGALRAAVLTYGARLQDLRLDGVGWPLTLGSDSLAAYEGPMAYAGPVVGPVANRIAGASASLAGRTHAFEANDGTSTLHGGTGGTHARVWRIVAATADAVTLALDLPDGLGGFPGNRHLVARFALGPGAAMTLALTATTDAPTWINLANHSYWTLDPAPTIAGQMLEVAAHHYLPVDDRRLPAGPPAPVTGTRLDFRAGRVLALPPDLDHCFCLAPARRPAPVLAARLTGRSGLALTLETTEPGLQVYDGSGLTSAPFRDLSGRETARFGGLALEPQGWPDAPNRPDFPSVALAAGGAYAQTTRWRLTRPGGIGRGGKGGIGGGGSGRGGG